MRISHSYKFLFLAITKTGSTTVRKLLDPFSDIKSKDNYGNFAHHALAKQVQSEFVVNGWIWNDYYKFTLVRNPIARLHSIHAYMIDIGSSPSHPWIMDNAAEFYARCVDYASRGITFEESVLSDQLSMPPQVNTVLSDSGEMLIDSFIKLENINSELPLVWKRIGLPEAAVKDIPVLNSSKISFNENLFSSLDERVVRKIRMDYAQDFELFDY